MQKDIFKRHQIEYANTMIKAYLTLAKRHNEDVSDIIEEVFYWDNFNDIIITFTNKGKLINYKIIKNNLCKNLS